MAERDRKQRLRSLQQTAQIQTGGLPSISSYQPKAAPQGKTNEAQMANALAQLAPSLTEFLGTRFQTKKKEDIARGRQQFFQDTASQRQQRKLDITLGRLDEDEFFVEGYQRSWLRNLGRSYGLGLTQMVDKLDKTSSDEEFLGALDKYTEEFYNQNGINLYQDEFINEEFLPQQETFKNVAQQAFGAQRLQFIREQRDASFSIEIGNKFSDLDDRLSNIGVENLGVNSLGDLLNSKEDLITNFNNLAGTNFTKDTPVSELYSAATQHLEIVLKDAGVEDFTALNQDVSRYDEFIEDEDTRKFIKNVNALSELQGTQLEVNQLVNDYIRQTGDPRKGNKLAAESIAEFAFQQEDVDIVDLIDLIQTPGGSWGNTEEGKVIKRQMKERIQNDLDQKEAAKLRAKEAKDKAIVKSYQTQIDAILSGKDPFTGKPIKVERDEAGVIEDPKIRNRLQLLLDGLGRKDIKAKSFMMGYIKDYTPQEKEAQQKHFQYLISIGGVSKDEVFRYGPALGYDFNQLSAIAENLDDRKYSEDAFKRGSTARMALDTALKLYRVTPSDSDDPLASLVMAMANKPQTDEIQQATEAMDFYVEVKDKAKQLRREIKKENNGIFNEEGEELLQSKLVGFIQEKIKGIKSKEDVVNDTLTVHKLLLTNDDQEFEIKSKKHLAQLIKQFDAEYISTGRQEIDEYFPNEFEEIVEKLYQGTLQLPQYNRYVGNLEESYKYAVELLYNHYGVNSFSELAN